MKKVLIGVVAVLALVVLAAFVVPALIDWNGYKQDIATEVEKATGRKITITGDLSLSVLPSPSFSASGIAFANAEGGSAEPMVSLEEIAVEVALFPLISGDIQVESIVLRKPVILLETLADGSSNLEMTPPAATGGSDGGAGGGGPAISLDKLTVEDGVVIYRDLASGQEERIEDLDAGISAGSLSGPFSLVGTAQVRGLPTTFSAEVGALAGTGAPPFKLTMGLPDSGAQLTVDGKATAEGGLAAQIGAKGSNLAAALRQLSGSEGMPPLLGQDFELATQVTLDETAIIADQLTLSLGPNRGSGRIAYLLGEQPSIEAKLAFPQLDLDALVEQAVAPSEAAPVAQDKEAATGEGAEPATLLPPGLAGTLELSVGALTYRGQAIQDVVLAADIANDVVTLHDIAMQLPGPSTFGLSGKVALEDGAPTFDGQVSLVSDQLRDLLSWLAVDVSAVPADRLGRLDFKSAVTANANQVTLDSLAVNLDSTSVSGGLVASLGSRPGLGIGLTVDRLNLDAYMPPASAGAGGDGSGDAGGPGDPLALLNAFDANIDLRIGSLTYQETQVGDIRVEGTLEGGLLTLKQARLGTVAGGSVNYSGTVKADGPTLDGTLGISASDPERLGALAGLPAGTLEPLGPFGLAANLKGTPAAMAFNASLNAQGGEFTAAGTYRAEGDQPMALTVGAIHPDLPALLANIGQGGTLPSGFGGINASAEVTLGSDSVAVSGLQGQVGPIAFEQATLQAALAGRPAVTIDATTGVIDLAAFAGGDSGGGGGGGGSGERWSSESLGLEGLRDFDATAKIKAAALVEGDTRIENATLDLVLKDGLLTLNSLEGQLNGGTLKANGTVDARETPQLDAEFSLSKLQLGPFFAGMFPVGEPSGQASAIGHLTSQGASVAALVDAVDGVIEAEGVFNLKTGGVGVLGGEGLAIGGKVLQGLLGDQAKGLGTIANVTDGAALLIKAIADHDSPFVAKIDLDGGVATLRQVQVNGRGITAKAEGTADLLPFTGDVVLSIFLNDKPDQPYYQEKRTGLLDDPAEIVRTGLLLSGDAPQDLPDAESPDPLEGILPEGVQELIPGTEGDGAIPGLGEIVDGLTGDKEEAAPEEATSEEATPEEATPEEATPEGGTTEDVTTEETAPEEATAEEASPEAAAPDATAPADAATDAETTPDETAPAEAAPEAGTEGAAPTEPAAEEVAPAEPAPDAAAPDAVPAETAPSDDAAPEAESPAAVAPEGTTAEEAAPEATAPAAEEQSQGDDEPADAVAESAAEAAAEAVESTGEAAAEAADEPAASEATPTDEPAAAAEAAAEAAVPAASPDATGGESGTIKPVLPAILDEVLPN